MKTLLLSTLLFGVLIACQKEEVCHKATRVYIEDSMVKQSFDDGTVVTLGRAGQNYNAHKNTCEL